MSHGESGSIPTPASGEELDRLISEPDEAVVQSIGQCEGRFAVLGAGGKMGFHVAAMLQRALERLGRSDPVLAVSRFSESRAQERFAAAGIETMAVDMSDPDQLAVVPAVENAVYLAGVKFGTTASPDQLKRLNVDMPRLVAEHFRDSRIVALSTGCVYSFTTPESGGSKESDPTDPPGTYAASCLGREQSLTEVSRQHRTPCVLVRLNYSIDLRYGVLVDLAERVITGVPVDVQMGYVNVIWQGDAVAQILRCLPLATSPPLVLNVTGAEVLRVRDLAQGLADRFGCRVSFTGTEAPTAWLSNSGEAQRRFGPPRVSVDQMLDWVATWLRRGGETLGKPTHFETRDGNY